MVYGRNVKAFAEDLEKMLDAGWRFFVSNFTSRAQAPTRRKKGFQFTMVFSKDIFRNPNGLPKNAILIGLILLPEDEISEQAIRLEHENMKPAEYIKTTFKK